MPRGAVFVPFCYYEAAANMLTNPVLDPFGKIPGVQVLRGEGDRRRRRAGAHAASAAATCWAMARSAASAGRRRGFAGASALGNGSNDRHQTSSARDVRMRASRAPDGGGGAGVARRAAAPLDAEDGAARRGRRPRARHAGRQRHRRARIRSRHDGRLCRRRRVHRRRDALQPDCR